VLTYLHAPVSEALTGPVGSGAWLLAFVLIFGIVFILGKLASRRLGGRVRRSVVGPLDRLLGAMFGGLKGLIGATLLFLALNFVFDLMWGRTAPRPLWMSDSRSYPLLEASGGTISDLVEAQRGAAAESEAQSGPAKAQ
jgi:membrane protein required for colicin V production